MPVLFLFFFSIFVSILWFFSLLWVPYRRAFLTLSLPWAASTQTLVVLSGPSPVSPLNPSIHPNTRIIFQKWIWLWILQTLLPHYWREKNLSWYSRPSMLTSPPSFLCTVHSWHNWPLLVSQLAAPLMFHTLAAFAHKLSLPGLPFPLSPSKSYSYFRNLLRCQAPVKLLLAPRR